MNTDYLMEKKNFHLFYKVLLNKNLLSIVIQNKEYLVVFHKHEINSLHVYYLVSYVLFGLFILFIKWFTETFTESALRQFKYG